MTKTTVPKISTETKTDTFERIGEDCWYELELYTTLADQYAEDLHVLQGQVSSIRAQWKTAREKGGEDQQRIAFQLIEQLATVSYAASQYGAMLKTLERVVLDDMQLTVVAR